MTNQIEMMSKEEWKKSTKVKTNNKKKYKNIRNIVLVFIFCIGIFGSIFMNYGKIMMGVTRMKAIKYSEKEVEKYLSSPSTAKFPSFIFNSEDIKSELYSEDSEGTTWVVGGYVDSQNYMGAIVRKTWAVGIKFYNGGEKYDILSVDVK